MIRMREHHGLRPLLPEEERRTVVEPLDDTDQHAADDRAQKVADTADHRGRERDQPESEAGVVARRPLTWTEQQAAAPAKCSAQREREARSCGRR